MGYSAEINNEAREMGKGELYGKVQPEDLLQYGLIPELIGRLPIISSLHDLDSDALKTILTEPKNALILQYIALLKTEGVDVIFEHEAVEEIARIAEEVNNLTENIGARRLHTLMEFLLEDILFEPPVKKNKVTITAKMVDKSLSAIVENEDLSRYIL